MLQRFAATTLAAFVLAACQTVEGAGRDIQNAGEEISDTADEVEQDLQN
ncbi:MAG: entericidin A/B family lipoprotein [Rubricella sp.]